MKQPKRLTRLEKIEQAAAIKTKVISNPRHLIDLPPGAYRLEGEAAAREVSQYLILADSPTTKR